MLANKLNDQEIGVTNKSPTLSVVKTPVSMTAEQALKNMHAMLGDKRHTPEYVFDTVLTTKQREILGFSAGLKRSDLLLSFNDISPEKRLDIRSAVLMLGKLHSVFGDAKALDKKKFV
jgi:hypothetical protein